MLLSCAALCELLDVNLHMISMVIANVQNCAKCQISLIKLLKVMI